MARSSNSGWAAALVVVAGALVLSKYWPGTKAPAPTEGIGPFASGDTYAAALAGLVPTNLPEAPVGIGPVASGDAYAASLIKAVSVPIEFPDLAAAAAEML